MENFHKVFAYGFPDFNILTKEEKRQLLLPVCENIYNFFQNDENREAFEIWKIEYLSEFENLQRYNDFIEKQNKKKLVYLSCRNFWKLSISYYKNRSRYPKEKSRLSTGFCQI